MQQKYYNKKYHFREFYKENLVLLNIKNLWTLKFSKKLLHKYIKLFCVKEFVETQAYYLSLSILYQIHSVFHIFLLKSYENRSEERKIHIPESITINKHNEYKIEEIFNKKNAKNKF